VSTRVLVVVAKAVHVLVAARARANLARVRARFVIGLDVVQAIEGRVSWKEITLTVCDVVLEAVRLLVAFVASFGRASERFR